MLKYKIVRVSSQVELKIWLIHKNRLPFLELCEFLLPYEVEISKSPGTTSNKQTNKQTNKKQQLHNLRSCKTI